MASTTRPHECLINYLTRAPWSYTLYPNDNQRRRHSEIFRMMFQKIKLYIYQKIRVRIRYCRWIQSTGTVNFNASNWIYSRWSNNSSQRKANQKKISRCYNICWSFLKMNLCTFWKNQHSKRSRRKKIIWTICSNIWSEIQKYHADNGAFNNRIFKEITIAANQTIYFSGVYAHHQNGISESMINTVTYHARRMLQNEMICWKDVITT